MNQRRSPSCPLELEILEDRCLLSASVLSPAADNPQHILVQFSPESKDSYLGLSLLPGTTVTRSFEAVPGLYEVTLASGISQDSALEAYRADARVVLAEAESLFTISQVPTGADFSKLWGAQQIKAPQAWDVTTGTRQVIVSVMDTGINYTHPDLYNNIWLNVAEIPLSRRTNLSDADGDGLISFNDLNFAVNQGMGKITDLNQNGRIDADDVLAPMIKDTQGRDTGLGGWADGISQDGDTLHLDDLVGWNFVTNTNRPFDDNGHGTHVSGIIGASGTDGSGVVGVNWQVQLMSIKWMDASGVGYFSDFLDGLKYATAHGAMLSNNSWTGSGGNISFLKDAVKNTQSKGLIFVAAAGNSGANNDITPVYPANLGLDNIVAVAASDFNDNLAGFSNYGFKSVALAAPGVGIYSTWKGTGFATDGGTSMAAPYVTGVLALVKGLHPDWTYQQVIDKVLKSVDPLASLTGKLATGGRLNAARAVDWNVVYSTPFQAPTITNASSVANTISTLKVTFNKAINLSTFTKAAIIVKGPNGAAITVTAVTAVTGSSNKEFLVTLPTQTMPGNYAVQISTSVQDTVGFRLPSNLTTLAITAPGPQVVTFSPMLTGPNSTSAILVTFNKTIDPNWFRTTNVTLLGPTGQLISISGVRASGGTGNSQFLILFAAQSAPGIYTLKISGVRDTAGNTMAPYQGKFSLGSNGIAAIASFGATVGSPSLKVAPQAEFLPGTTVASADVSRAGRWQFLVEATQAALEQDKIQRVNSHILSSQESLQASDTLFSTLAMLRQVGMQSGLAVPHKEQEETTEAIDLPFCELGPELESGE